MNARSIGIMFLLSAVSLIGCTQTPQPPSTGTRATTFVIIGESNATGAEAAQEIQLAINRAHTVGCKAKSIGGYGAAPEGMVLGLAVIIECPADVHIIPTGFPYDSNTGMKIPVDPALVIPPPLNPPPTP